MTETILVVPFAPVSLSASYASFPSSPSSSLFVVTNDTYTDIRETLPCASCRSSTSQTSGLACARRSTRGSGVHLLRRRQLPAARRGRRRRRRSSSAATSRTCSPATSRPPWTPSPRRGRCLQRRRQRQRIREERAAPIASWAPRRTAGFGSWA